MRILMNKLKLTKIVGIVFTISIGTLLHFLYNWSDNNRIAALFSPVNESIWEHLKMLFFPYMLYALMEYVYIGNLYANFITAKCMGVMCGLILIPIVSTLYTSLIGTNYIAVDIILFILSIILSYVVSYYILKAQKLNVNYLCKIILLIITIAFFLFTFYPPTLTLFQDPTAHSYLLSLPC